MLLVISDAFSSVVAMSWWISAVADGRLRVSPGSRSVADMSERIEINPRICGGQPVIKGTRISVPAILEQLAEAESWDSILLGYPELSRADIQAALDYARESILHTEVAAITPV